MGCAARPLRCHGISEDESARIEAGQPYGSLSDFWQRAHPSRPVAERLAEIGALGCLHDGRLTRRDLLLQIAELHRQSRNRTAGSGQLPISTGAVGGAEPSGLPEMTGREALSAELNTLGIDVSRHLMEHHHRLLREIGATDAAHLAGHAGRAAGPGRRGAGLDPDSADRQRQAGHLRAPWRTAPAWSTWPSSRIPIRPARTRSSTPGCCWSAARSRSAAPGAPSSAPWPGTWTKSPPPAATTAPRPPSPSSAPTARSPTPAQPRRTLANGTTGARLHPYADLQPAGTRSADLKKFGHTSPGSAG